ncbi:unnamed protein product [Clavelina lepadiformis]|uniref:DH domain-containing protein n=1 Tax=Clavelina lepadiformis TaxID=159417 RepID=A0ABP0GBW2_CLALP
MSDFLKIFRRQRSVKQIERPNSPREEKSSNSDDQNANVCSKQHEPAEQTSGIDVNVTHNADNDEAFREPKGWRKSLRKLRWRKRDSSLSSVSYDNISKVGAESSCENVQPNKVHSSPTLNKRWSYSPDLSEENVPGARELRGSLQRKLSIKVEVDEDQCCDQHPTRRQSNRVSYMRRGTLSHRYKALEAAEESMESGTAGSNEMSVVDENGKEKLRSLSKPEIGNNLDLSENRDLSEMSRLSASQPIPRYENVEGNSLEKGSSSPGLVEWSEATQTIDSSLLSPPSDTQFSVAAQSESSIQQSTSARSLSMDTSDGVETPYDLDDINDVLGSLESRSHTLGTLHGQDTMYDTLDRDHKLKALTGSLMRGRAGTKFERDAEYALENVEYQRHQYEDAPVAHYYRQLNDSKRGNAYFSAGQNENGLTTADGGEGIYEDYEVPTPDDNSSWGSHEFDSTSEESDDNNEKSDKSQSRSEKVQKLKFWGRTSLKKKNSVSSSPKPVEYEQGSFVEFHIPPNRHPSPQLPPITPTGLSEGQVKRRRIVATIISSEKSYTDSLQRLESDYKQALLDHKPPIIGPDIVEKIFYKLSAILQCHRLFQIGLAMATASWDEQELIGGTFVASFSKSMVLECYGDFINNFTVAMDTVSKTCMRKPQFLAFLRERQSTSNDRLNLYGLMLKPVQRFPQFIMLVQDLLKHTPSGHADRLPLQLALTELETLAERLNQRKADNEDASDLRNLLENSNLKLTAQTKDGRARKLIKQGDVKECKHNEDGLLEKVKDCLLVLTNDMLICCSINNRRPQRGGSSTYKDMYKLKWRVALDVVEVTDGSPRPSHQAERETLHADYIKLQQIAKLIDRLQLAHEGMTPQVVQKCLGDLQTKIRQAEQLATQPEDASFTVRFPGNNRTETRTLVLTYNSHKDEWLEAISRTKLENAPSNIDAWFSSDSGESEASWKAPLFLRSLSAHMSYETLQVQCSYSFMPSSHVTLLWLSCAASTVLAVVSVYYITEDRVEKVHVMQVESSVQCMEHWNPFYDNYSVWLGMESGCLLEYSADGSYRKLSEVSMPTMSTVMIMKAHKNNLYVGLLDGTLAMYSRTPGASDLQHISSITVGTGPLVCLSPVADKLWGCSGNNVVTIDMETFQTESSRSLLLDGENLVVNLVTRVGSGLWVAFCDECNLNLYHLESLDRLQEINLSRVIRDFVLSLDAAEKISENCTITSMWSGHSQLFVGTSNGLLLAMPLPKLPGSLPKITGPSKVCRHSLRGPLTFLFAPELPPPLVGGKAPSNPNMYDGKFPPPLPRRDDLDETIVPEKEDLANDVTSEVRKTSVPSRPTSAVHLREVPPPPYVKHNVDPYSPRITTPPPRPSDLDFADPFSSSRSFSCDRLTENKSLYEHMELQSLESPRKDTFVHWSETTARHCPVVIACGEGYRRFSSKAGKSQSSNQTLSPTILCWKVMTS